MIYLASPYSDPSLAIRTNRYLAVCKAAASLIAGGEVVFSPIAHGHGIVLCGDLPTGWDYWEKVDRAFLAVCDCVYVLMLDGWRESKGITAEVELATMLGKKVSYIDPDEPNKPWRQIEECDCGGSGSAQYEGMCALGSEPVKCLACGRTGIVRRDEEDQPHDWPYVVWDEEVK